MNKPEEKTAVVIDEPVFEDSASLPRGRKARSVSEPLKAALEDSAKRGVGKVVTGSETMIGTLVGDLGSAWVKRNYVITTETESLPGNRRKLVFSATAKPAE
jgi:hypothetical protein